MTRRAATLHYTHTLLMICIHTSPTGMEICPSPKFTNLIEHLAMTCWQREPVERTRQQLSKWFLAEGITSGSHRRLLHRTWCCQCPLMTGWPSPKQTWVPHRRGELPPSLENPCLLHRQTRKVVLALFSSAGRVTLHRNTKESLRSKNSKFDGFQDVISYRNDKIIPGIIL